MTRPRALFRSCLESRLAELRWTPREIRVERPADPRHGDLSTPVALALSKSLGRPPREIAEELIAGLALSDVFGAVDIAGPGFINARLAPDYLRGVVSTVLDSESIYGRSERLTGTTANVEFVSSNPTGPLHIGHARNAVLGDAIAALLEEQGASVTREYYFNDAGRQMDILAASVFARYQQRWDPDFPFPEKGYGGEYIGELAAEAADQTGDQYRGVDESDARDFFRAFAGTRITDGIKADLERFGIEFDVWFNESTLYDDGRMEATLDDLRSAGAVFEEDGAVWFRASAYGDEKDRVLVKQTGQPTYLLPDIAYHRDKHDRGFDIAIDIWGADHHAYAVRMQAALRALAYPEGWLRTVIYQQVGLREGGKDVRLSTRAGRMIGLAELMDDIGIDVTRYFLLMRKGDTPMVFDLDLARRESDENPVYYVQYAHARIESVFQKLEVTEWGPAGSAGVVGLDRLGEPEELAVLQVVEQFPDVLSDAADALEPHRVTDYLEELAKSFHLWYHQHRILTDDEELTRGRLALARAVQVVIRRGLAVLGVSAPNSM